MKAAIMAGGEGSRLRPLTCGRPKPMVPVGNRPIMEYTVDLLRKHGLSDVAVTLQYLPDAIRSHFGDGGEYGVSMRYYVEEQPLGTAGSVKNAAGFLDQTFVVVSGDALTDLDLEKAIAFHQEKGSLATLVLTSVPEPLEYGVVITAPDGRIVRFLEKPSWSEVFSDRVNTGIYILEPEALELIPEGKMFDFSKDLFPLLLEKRLPLYGCTLEGYWCDVGNLEQYVQAHRDLLEGKVGVDLPGALGPGGVRLGRHTVVHPAARVRGPALIGDDCWIGPEAEVEPFTVLGNRTRLEEGASLKRCVVWENAFIGRRCDLRGVVLGRGVRLEDRVSVFEGAVIGDGSSVGRGATVRPGLKIWPCKQVAEGAVLHESLVWGSGQAKRLFGLYGVPGRLNVDLVPELAARLGAAYASTRPAGALVAVSDDGSAATGSLKLALSAGLLSGGLAAFDLGSLPAPAHRLAVVRYGAGGGVHLMRDARDASLGWALFVDQRGDDLTPAETRKVENSFGREDYRRAEPGQMPGLAVYHGALEDYSEHLLREVDGEAVRERGFQVVAACQEPALRPLVRQVLQQLGCRLTMPEGNNNWPQDMEQARRDGLPDLAALVRQEGADLGFWLDRNGETVFLVDDEGRVLAPEVYLSLVARLVFAANGGGVLAVPLSAPGSVEELAGRFQGRVVRTRLPRYALMQAARSEEVRQGQERLSQGSLLFDSLQAVTRLLENLAFEQSSLSRLVQELPLAYTSQRLTPCPWKFTGQVMRALVEQQQGSDGVEMLDGIKVSDERGWVLVTPDGQEPYYRIFSEGVNQEAAEELCGFYVDLVESLVHGTI